jgi:serine/threonine protein kinase
MREALERRRGSAVPEFEALYAKLVSLRGPEATVPAPVLDSGLRLEIPYYAAIDLESGETSAARPIVAFLEESLEAVELERFRRDRAAPAGEPLAGVKFGAYRVVSKIGEGGMGAVYEARDETLARPAALKVLHPRFTGDAEYRKRFLREARIAASALLEHPNITQVYAAGSEGERLWIAMQLVRGKTLRRLLEARGPLPPREALSIARQAAEGLAAAHAARLVHRDIKPDNLMVDAAGRVKIMDFGLMRSTEVRREALTEDGVFVGTLEYASPEQCRDEEIDARTDLYSLGVVLYELLSGARPYSARTRLGYLSMIPDPSQPPVPLCRRNPRVPSEVEALVHRLLAKKREDRFADAGELVRAIDALGAPRAARPAGRAVASLAGWSVALAAAAVALVLLWPAGPAPAKAPPPAAPVSVPPAGTPPLPPAPPAPTAALPAPPPPPPSPPPPPRPPAAARPRDPRLEILSSHRPGKAELDFLERLLEVSRASLAARSGYAFDEAIDRVLRFRDGASPSPWAAIFVEAEAERFQAAGAAFRKRPLFAPEAVEHSLLLRDGSEVRGRAVREAADRVAIEAAGGALREVALSQVAPRSFAAARGTRLEAVLVRSAAGDAAGALEALERLDEVDRRRLFPLLLDQSIEELLRSEDFARLAAYEVPEPYRETAEALLAARLKSLALEREAAGLYGRKDGLGRLVTGFGATRAGAAAARDALSSFERSIPPEEKFELVGPEAWGTWEADVSQAPGGSAVGGHDPPDQPGGDPREDRRRDARGRHGGEGKHRGGHQPGRDLQHRVLEGDLRPEDRAAPGAGRVRSGAPPGLHLVPAHAGRPAAPADRDHLARRPRREGSPSALTQTFNQAAGQAPVAGQPGGPMSNTTNVTVVVPPQTGAGIGGVPGFGAAGPYAPAMPPAGTYLSSYPGWPGGVGPRSAFQSNPNAPIPVSGYHDPRTGQYYNTQGQNVTSHGGSGHAGGVGIGGITPRGQPVITFNRRNGP